jgi:hypothetical protein
MFGIDMLGSIRKYLPGKYRASVELNATKRVVHRTTKTWKLPEVIFSE